MNYHFGATMKDVRITLLYLKPRGEALEDGEVIASNGVVATGPNPKLNMNPKVFFDVSFGEGSPLEELGIKQTLPTLFNHVMDTSCSRSGSTIEISAHLRSGSNKKAAPEGAAKNSLTPLCAVKSPVLRNPKSFLQQGSANKQMPATNGQCSKAVIIRV